MHRWHHALEIRDGVNFATKFAFWDWLFGTARLPKEKPSGFGILEPFPRGYLAQQLHAFLPRREETVTNPITNEAAHAAAQPSPSRVAG